MTNLRPLTHTIGIRWFANLDEFLYIVKLNLGVLGTASWHSLGLYLVEDVLGVVPTKRGMFPRFVDPTTY